MVGLAYNGTVIFPKYNIGDIRYFPRVYDRFHEDETTDGEYTIIRRKVVFEPSVKAKEVRSIEVIVGYDRTTSIGYRMLTVGEKEDIIFRIARSYDQEKLEQKSFATYEEAMEAAKKAAAEEKCWYE